MCLLLADSRLTHAAAVVVPSPVLFCCRNDTIFAVKAPAGTTLEVPEPEMHQMEDGKLAQRFRCGCAGLLALQGIAVSVLTCLYICWLYLQSW
jgi:hypothetical protein